MRRLKFVIVLLVLSARPVFATESEAQLRAGFIGTGLHGWIQGSGETEPSTLREARFYFDGEAYRLSMAGFMPIRFGVGRLWIERLRLDDQPWVSIRLTWDDPGLRVALTFRPDAAVAHATVNAFEGRISTAPRVLLSVFRKTDKRFIGLGALASLDQGSSVAKEAVKYLETLDHRYVTFDMVEAQRCRDLIEKSRIRVRQ